ncbi:capsule biosynthesis protein [Paracoccaceae bacterium Fryx2]|nr:capsule biosynthesis protein [Paracoccaceae bacterium Fryx2]
MTMKLKAKRFRIRRPDPVAPPPADPAALFETEDEDGFGAAPFATASAPRMAAPQDVSSPAEVASETDMDAIRREGLTGRQLRMARRVAQKHNLPATSDFDAVRLLRQAGIDPFQRTNMLELVTSEGTPVGSQSRALTPVGDGVQLPQTVKPIKVPSTEVRAEVSHAAEIMRMQQDIARRRRRKMVLLSARLLFFVLLPTLLTGYYYFMVATPLFATKSEFVIQQAQNPSAASGGLGGLLQGSPMATSQDSIAVQGYLQSREAMLRLDADMGFRAHFSQPQIDPIQRLAADATSEAAYKLYKRNVLISYDPTEGLVKMEVIAADPAISEQFARHLIGYAEEQVDQLTQRLREDQMQGARDSYTMAEANMLDAQRQVVELQEKFKILSSEVEVSLITSQIGGLETQLTTDRLSLTQMESNANPNAARVEPLKRRIAAVQAEIAAMRAKLTEDGAGGLSLAKVQSELLVAQADVQTRQLLLAQSLQSMETARVEANRQVRYLSLSVSPVAPDEATYPRAFENTMVAMLIFAGIYLMISMTAAILREQVTA